MPRRASGSQSQTQIQHINGRRRRQEEEEVEEDDEEEVNDEGEGEEEATQTQGGAHIENLRKKAAGLAKMALIGEYSRRPLKRADVSALVLGGQTRQFPMVLREAQEILRAKFGMELRELRPKIKVDAASAAAGPSDAAGGYPPATQRNGKRKGRDLENIDEEEVDEENEGEQAENMPAKKQKKQPSTGLYILRNILPAELLASMATPHPLPAFDRAAAPDEEDSGALLQWEKGDGSNGHIGLLGIRSLILILILASNRVLSDDDLHAYLKRLKIYRDTPLNYVSPDSREPPLTLDKYLDLLAKQHYLEKSKTPNHTGGAETHKIEWRWGSREVEFTEQDMAKWAQAVMIDSQEDAFDDEAATQAPEGSQRRGRTDGDAANPMERNTAEKARARLRKDLEKAAGSALRGYD